MSGTQTDQGHSVMDVKHPADDNSSSSVMNIRGKNLLTPIKPVGGPPEWGGRRKWQIVADETRQLSWKSLQDWLLLGSFYPIGEAPFGNLPSSDEASLPASTITALSPTIAINDFMPAVPPLTDSAPVTFSRTTDPFPVYTAWRPMTLLAISSHHSPYYSLHHHSHVASLAQYPLWPCLCC